MSKYVVCLMENGNAQYLGDYSPTKAVNAMRFDSVQEAMEELHGRDDLDDLFDCYILLEITPNAYSIKEVLH